MNRYLVTLAASLLLVTSACTAAPSTTVKPSTAATPAGQATATPAAPATSTPAAEQQKLVVWTRNYTVRDNGDPSPFFVARDIFQAAHPNVTVELSGVGYDDQYNRLVLSQAGSIADKPDVFLMDNIWLGQFTEGLLADNLDSYYASWTGKDDIVDAYVESSKWNGSQHGVWAYSDIRLFLWNKDVFTAAGLDPEKPPTTWDEVMTDAAAIKAANLPGVSAVGFPAASQEGTVDRFYSYLFMNGSDILNADNTQAVFNDAGGQKAVQFLVDLVKAGYTPQDVLVQDADAVVDATIAGKYGMMLATVGDGSANRPEGMSDADFKAHYGAALPPICDGCQQATTAGGWMLGINTDSTKKDLAWEYIMDVTEGSNMVDFEAFFVRVPVRKSGLAQADKFTTIPYFDQFTAAVDVAHFPPFVAQYTAMIEPIWTGIQSAIQGPATVQEALDQAATDVNAILAGT